MNENSTFTLYDFIMLVYKSKLTVLVYGIISALVSIFIITFWSGESKYSVGYYITPNIGIKTDIGSEINHILSEDGFDRDYFFQEFYNNLQSFENFQNNLNDIKNDLISLYPEFKSDNLKNIPNIYSQFNFEYEDTKDYDLKNIFASSFTNFSNIEVDTFILQNHIKSTSLLLLDNLNIYYTKEKIDANKKIVNLREIRKSSIKDHIDREIYLRDTKLEQILNEFDKDIAYIEEDISIAKLMGYIDPIIEYNSEFPFPIINTTIPEYYYGVKILEKKLENLLSNKNIMIQNKIIEHQIIIDNYSKTSSDAFIPEMNSFKGSLKNIESILIWIENISNKSNIFINYNKNDLSIKRISQSNITTVLISLMLGMFLGFFVYLFRNEKSNRNNDLS